MMENEHGRPTTGGNGGADSSDATGGRESNAEATGSPPEKNRREKNEEARNLAHAKKEIQGSSKERFSRYEAPDGESQSSA